MTDELLKVKALEWYEPTDHPQDMEDSSELVAHGLGGRYRISKRAEKLHMGGSGHLLWMAHDEFIFQEYRTIEEAQAAAYKDHNNRILAQLDLAPVDFTGLDAALDELRKPVDEVRE